MLRHHCTSANPGKRHASLEAYTTWRRLGEMNVKLRVTAGIAGVFGLILLGAAVATGQTGTDEWNSVALLVLGASSGWLIGTVASPYDRSEKDEFRLYARAFLTFVSGYAASQIKEVLKLLSARLSDPVSQFRVVGTASAFIIALLVTFIFRRYWGTEDQSSPATVLATDQCCPGTPIE